MKLYDYILSGNCYKIRLFLSFLDINYETVPVDYYPGREHRFPDFLEINPLGQLPVLVDDEVKLRDAQAILIYLASKYDTSGRWYPRNPEAMGKIAMWLSFAGTEIMNSSNARLHDMLAYDLDADKARANAHAAFRILDDHLVEVGFAGQEWIAGTQPSIADVACFPYVALSRDGGIEHDDYPAIQSWLTRIQSLPRFIDMPGIHFMK
ncbi:MAG: glutathione S-transferase family protein [SAR324 cluster bacterium]|nr:glutathione S-transferase family protein [SAR324 cluster bacterium]